MEEHKVEYVDLPLTTKPLETMEQDDIEGVTDCGDCYRVNFDAETFSKRSSKPYVPMLKELLLAFMAYLRDNKPELIECKVEKALRDEGFSVLWTPPYTPDLQPIEMFWDIAKNRITLNYNSSRTMKQTVQLLREGWYGTSESRMKPIIVGHW